MPLPFLPPFVDPFSEAQARIEQILSESLDLEQFVVKAVVDGDPLTITAPADYGEFRVVPVPGGAILPRRTSTSTDVLQHFQIGVVTDVEDVKMAAFPIKFGVVRAILRATQSSPDFGLPYVRGFTFVDVREDPVNADYNRGIPGWTSIIVISLAMSFKTADLVEE